MIRYEIKKVFSSTGNKIALLLLLLALGIVCYFSCNISYVNELGEKNTGFAAVKSLRMAQKEWAGILDENKIKNVIAENKKITHSKEYLSKNTVENEIAYSHIQGIEGIRNLFNYSYALSFQDYNYYRANDLVKTDAPNFYYNRIILLKKFLKEDGSDQFSKKEKTYLVHQYEILETPFYYDYIKGWSQLFEFAPTMIMITMLILGYLVAGIFSNEFSWKADAIFFSSIYGRNKASAAKIIAGFCIVSIIYIISILTYTGITLLYLGIDGWKCPIQINQWKSFYNITIGKEYLLIFIGGYLGCLFISFLSMFVSAKTKSAAIAVIIPFVLIFLPSFVSNIQHPMINKILGLLPDQLLQMGTALNYFNLYSIAGKIIGAIPILLTIYTLLTLLLLPIIYQLYRHKKID